MHSVTEGTNFWEYFVAWRTTDFYVFNPVDDESQTMDYPTYRRKILAGDILPAPRCEVERNLHNPIHVEHDGA